MRICLYTHRALPGIGSQETAVDALARRFTARGHQVVVLAPRRRVQDLSDTSSLPYRVERHPPFCSSRWFVAWYGRWLTRLHAQYRFEVVTCHGVYPCGYVAASCPAMGGVPLVVTSHGDDLDPLGLYEERPELRDRYRLALERADAAISIGDFAQQQFRKICPDLRHIERIPNGVDAGRFAAAAPRPAGLDPALQPKGYLLFLGRLDWRKGADLLLRAFAKVADSCSLNLAIAGSGPELPALKAQAIRSKLDNRVRFLGRVDEATKVYLLQNGLCTVVPSRIWEACPMVVLESYAAGRPVIGCQIPGLGELIHSERTGLVVPPDCAIRLAEAIHRVARDPAGVSRWGEEARRMAGDYDFSRIADRHLALFEELTGSFYGREAA